jgi:hypothetical protein
MNNPEFGDALIAIQREFVDMPGLKLTLGQAVRLWAMPAGTCQTALAALVASGFLVDIGDGRYGRRGTPPVHVEALDTLTWAVAPASGQA